MNADQLKELAEAYGGDPRRWPDAERAAATTWASEHPLEASRVLFEARQLDAALDMSPKPAVSRDLRDRVIASAAALEPRRGWFLRWTFPTIARGAWLSGAGMAAAACAGVVVGQGLVGELTADLQADAVLYEASLPLDDTEVLG